MCQGELGRRLRCLLRSSVSWVGERGAVEMALSAQLVEGFLWEGRGRRTWTRRGRQGRGLLGGGLGLREKRWVRRARCDGVGETAYPGWQGVRCG